MIQKLFFRFGLCCVLLGSFLHAEEIDTLLQMVEKHSDLSEKTKLANGGISFVWTRDDLNRMQITNLKQILKTAYPFGYNENRLALVDPLTYQSGQPFLSSVIRLYIDNQEITTGLYGSGIFLMGDANIDWVDHVEIYTQNPTYEYATEPTITLVKLYSKSVAKDEGNMLKAEGGSYGQKRVDGFQAGYIGEWSYFVFCLLDDAKRQKYKSFQTTLSRDREVQNIVATLHKGETNILFDAFHQQRDGFLGMSLDATPTNRMIHAEYAHLGIDSKVGDFSYVLTGSYDRTKANMEDDVTPIPSAPFYGMFPIASAISYTSSYTATAEMKYKHTFAKHTLLGGLKYRFKKGVWDKSFINGVNMAQNDDKKLQSIWAVYFEDQYALEENSIITVGCQFEDVETKDSWQSDDFFMYRIGHTYLDGGWSFKTFFSHLLVPMEPYLIGSYTYLAHPQTYYNPTQYDTFAENVIYENGPDKYEAILDYTHAKDYLLPLEMGKLVNYDKTMKMSGVDLRWTHLYRKIDKLFVRGSYRLVQNTPEGYFHNLQEFMGVVRSINTANNIDFFNELVYKWNNAGRENHFNFSCGGQYTYNKSVTVGVKALNIFNDARTNRYVRINPQTLQPEAPLFISPMDREIVASVKWVF